MKYYVIIPLLVAASMARAHILSTVGCDDALLRGGQYSAIVQDADGILYVKNADEEYQRISMMKLNLTNIESAVDTATFSFSVKADEVMDRTVYVWAVKDGAPGQSWSGTSTTFDSVIASGMFVPQENLHTESNPNLTLLYSGVVANGGGHTPDRRVSFSNSDLVDALNSRLDDDDLTLIFFTAENKSLLIRSFGYSINSDCPQLKYTMAQEPSKTLDFITM